MKTFINIILLSIYSLLAFSQDGVQINGAQLTVGSQAVFYVDGNVESNGDILNQNEIIINGNWESSGAYSSSGAIRFIGGDQTIDNYSNTFNKVLITGGGIKTVPSGFNISDSLTLDDGILKPYDTAKIVALSSALISDGDEYAHVDGMFYHEGVGTKFYPLGKDEEFRPVEMNVSEGDAVVGYELHKNLETTNPRYEYPVIELQTNYYWEQNIASGTLDSALLILPYDELNLVSHNTQTVMEAKDLQSMFRTTEPHYNNSSFRLGSYFQTLSSGKHITGSYFAVGVQQLYNWDLKYVPDALSPNAENPEDQVIKIYGAVFYDVDFLFKVVNQWGNEVFRTTDLEFMQTVGWDGTNSKTNKKEVTGQYQYILKAKKLDSEYHSEAGSLYIID